MSPMYPTCHVSKSNETTGRYFVGDFLVAYVYEVPASREDGIVPATPAKPGSTSSSCVVCGFLEW